ncbi:MAG TPA: TlpA disulfide reductase family protein [Caulobacteraceae bacterium]|jgi:thiol-disulfide isomerase/thioredoxin|nr:TlpA disulfide reductase family protein [Caulobacteraceae bacterium]
MTDFREGEGMDRARRRPWTYALWGGVMIGLAVVLYVIAELLIKSGGAPDLKSLAKGGMKGLTATVAGSPPPSMPILGPDGQPTDLTRLKAPVLVVNLWATWCAPCVTEMPTLAKLQAAYPGRILVVPVSMDTAKDREKARAFIAQYPPLPFYQDPKATMVFTITPPAEGLPTTILYGKDGREKARVSGGADWSGADAHAVVEALLAKK